MLVDEKAEKAAPLTEAIEQGDVVLFYLCSVIFFS